MPFEPYYEQFDDSYKSAIKRQLDEASSEWGITSDVDPESLGAHTAEPDVVPECIELTEFDKWYNEATQLVLKMQQHPFADYRKNKWKKKRGVWLQMYNEGATPAQAANLWGLNHQKPLR